MQISGRWGCRPQSIYGQLDRGMMKLQLCHWKFSHRNLVADVFRQKLNFTAFSRFDTIPACDTHTDTR